jgi:hypothetical protein
MALIDDIKDPAAREAVRQIWSTVLLLQSTVRDLTGDVPGMDAHYHKRISAIETKMKEVRERLGIAEET